jgi:hypothetical protein
MTVAPRPPDTPIIGSPPPNGGPKPKTVPVEPGAYRLSKDVFPDPKPKVVSDLPPTSTDGDVPPATTDDKDEFPEPKPRVVSDDPPTSTDGDLSSIGSRPPGCNTPNTPKCVLN